MNTLQQLRNKLAEKPKYIFVSCIKSVYMEDVDNDEQVYTKGNNYTFIRDVNGMYYGLNDKNCIYHYMLGNDDLNYMFLEHFVFLT